MPKIKKITLTNFKFFYGKEEIELNRHNLLLFGENGSGKSSIYWSLYTFLQSVFKSNDNIKKYFDRTKSENLVNRFSDPGQESSIIVEFEKENHSTFTHQISLDTINTKDGNYIKEAVKASDFISYKLLAKLYDFTNSAYIDLFPILEQEVLMFINFTRGFTKRDGGNSGVNANDWWKYINSGLNPQPKMHEKDYKDFQTIVSSFNVEMNRFLNKIIQSANEYLNSKFKLPITLFIQYKDCSFNDFWPNTKSRSWRAKPPKVFITTEYNHEKLPYAKRAVQKPHTFLNEAKLSAIALSIRLAILEEKYQKEAAKILVIDDMLISLDMSNRNTVLDIILQDFPEYQILFMTHDKMFFEMARNKIKHLKQSNWEYIEMYSHKTNEIPLPLIYKSESYLGKAIRYLAENEYEISGNFLRKEAESFLKEILPNKYKLNDEGKVKALGNLLSESEVFAESNNLNKGLFEKLNSHREFILNSASHDSYDIPKYYSELLSCIETLKELRKIEVRPDILAKGTYLEFTIICKNEGASWRYEIKLGDNIYFIQEPATDGILTKSNINFRIYKDGIEQPPKDGRAGEWRHDFTSLRNLFDYCYKKSDETQSANFWDVVIFTETRQAIKTLRTF